MSLEYRTTCYVQCDGKYCNESEKIYDAPFESGEYCTAKNMVGDMKIHQQVTLAFDRSCQGILDN